MSIVGTRPPLISETNLYEPHHKVSVIVGKKCGYPEATNGNISNLPCIGY